MDLVWLISSHGECHNIFLDHAERNITQSTAIKTDATSYLLKNNKATGLDTIVREHIDINIQQKYYSK